MDFFEKVKMRDQRIFKNMNGSGKVNGFIVVKIKNGKKKKIYFSTQKDLKEYLKKNRKKFIKKARPLKKQKELLKKNDMSLSETF